MLIIRYVINYKHVFSYKLTIDMELSVAFIMQLKRWYFREKERSTMASLYLYLPSQACLSSTEKKKVSNIYLLNMVCSCINVPIDNYHTYSAIIYKRQIMAHFKCVLCLICIARSSFIFYYFNLPILHILTISNNQKKRRFKNSSFLC